jgi:hypothetical protein
MANQKIWCECTGCADCDTVDADPDFHCGREAQVECDEVSNWALALLCLACAACNRAQPWHAYNIARDSE